MYKIWTEEIRRTISKKAVWCGVVLILVFATIRLYGTILREYLAVIDGQTYSGREAIQKEKELAGEYAGPMTEEKVRQIYERFGFYYYDMEKEEYVGNFWNEYLTKTMTNYDETNGGQPEEIRFLEGEDWEDRAAPLLKGNLKFDYNYGWEDMRQTVTLVTLLLSILFIIGTAPVFSEEYTLRTADVLLTTRHGRKAGIWLKIAAALILTAVIYSLVFLYLWLIYRNVFGTQGLDSSPVFLDGIPVSAWYPETVGGFIRIMYIFGLLSIILLTAAGLAVSAFSRSAFLSVVVSAALFIIPYAWMQVIAPMKLPGTGFTKIMNHFMTSMPYYLQMNWGFGFSRQQLVMHVVTAAAAAAACVMLGYRKYRDYQGW